MSITGDKLTLTNRGDSTAYYPIVLHLLSDGRWESLAFPQGKASPTELLPGAKVELAWADARTKPNQWQLESLRPVMVHFYDQAGSGFGQISFFNQPQIAPKPLAARYYRGLMAISPPSNGAIHASWLLWPQENGIDALRYPLDLSAPQPPVKRIEWHAGMRSMRVDLGAGEPSAILLHETDGRLLLQNLASGGLQGRQQRAAWLDAEQLFYRAAQLAVALAIIALLADIVAKRRAGPPK